MALLEPQQSMKMGVGVTGRERKTHWDLEPVIEFASGRIEAQRIVRLRQE